MAVVVVGDVGIIVVGGDVTIDVVDVNVVSVVDAFVIAI